MRSNTHTGAVRAYPKAVQPGDMLCIRQAQQGGWYTDAATVQRGNAGREWSTVLSVTLVDGWYTIDTDSPTIPRITSAPNAKVLVRRQVAGS